MSSSPAPASSRSRAALWLTGAAALALAVQAIFLLVPAPQSAGATDPAAPEVTTALDSTAFVLEEDATALPGADASPADTLGGNAEGPADSVAADARRVPLADTTRPAIPAAEPAPPPAPDSTAADE